MGSKSPQDRKLSFEVVAPNYVLIVFYAEMEAMVKSMVADVIQGSSDGVVFPFLTKIPNNTIQIT